MGITKGVPKVLEERLLISEDDRNLMVAIEELSPKDTGNIYMTPSIFNPEIPTIPMIAKKTGKSSKQVLDQLSHIQDVWKIPDVKNLPTNTGFFDYEDALVSAVVNQHKTRWDAENKRYRVPKMHMISAQLGLGTLYTNEEAFEGEKILRNAMGLNEQLNSYHIQGGILPDFVATYGKAKNKRALMTGLNKTGKEKDEGELELLVKKAELINKELGSEGSLNQKQIQRMADWAVNTIGSRPEAAESAAYQMAPLIQDIPEGTPIHLYADSANLGEIEDQCITTLRKIHNRMESAAKDLPKLRKKKSVLETEKVNVNIGAKISNKAYDYLWSLRDDFEGSESEEGSSVGFKEKGKDFQNYLRAFQETNLDSLKEELRKDTSKIIGTEHDGFDELFEDTVNNYFSANNTFKKIEDRRGVLNRRDERIDKNLRETTDKINEAKEFENSRLVEMLDSPSWFTKKIAITPTEAKINELIKKKINSDLYKNIFIPKLKELTGKNLNIKLHTDDLITTHIPDPEEMIKYNGQEIPEDAPIGTLLTSMAQTNAQLSNEPLAESFAQLQGFHEGEVSERVKKGKSKPKKQKDFNKRDFASSDLYLTSYGADGARVQSRFTVGPTTIDGEYRPANPEISTYIKAPTRHKTSVIGEMMAKGNRGAWDAKRIVKGGCTTGNILQIEHADQSTESIFIDDHFYEKVSKDFGEEYNGLEKTIQEAENKLARARSPKSIDRHSSTIQKAKERLNEIHEEVKPVIYNILLQNDLHFGGYTTLGRPSLIDGVKASQLAAVQTLGFANIHYSITTEAMNGEQAWRSYDSRREGKWKDPLELNSDLDKLEFKLREQNPNISEAEVREYMRIYIQEQEDARPAFKQEEQTAIYNKVAKPLAIELAENGIHHSYGAGNHWMASKYGNWDEADILIKMLPDKYAEQGLVSKFKGSSGASFAMGPINLPGVSDPIAALVSHKMWSGKTELSQLAKQAVRMREDVKYVYTADRHQGGMVAERGKMCVLDMGKQPTVPYVKMIGKVSSLRGTMTSGYGANNENIVSIRSFMDPIVDNITGWDYKSGVLSRAHGLIEEANIDQSLYKERKSMDYLIDKNKGSTKSDKVMEKYGKKK